MQPRKSRVPDQLQPGIRQPDTPCRDSTSSVFSFVHLRVLGGGRLSWVLVHSIPRPKMLHSKFMSAPNSIFVRACKSHPVERTPVWFMRQAGRYMSEYRAVRKQHSLLEICKKPALAAAATITAAEALGVAAAIIFADLLLPLEVMGLPFRFSAGEGPVIEKPVRTKEDIAQLRTDRGDGDFGGQRRFFADFKQRMLLAYGPVFAHVAPSLTHEPDRSALNWMGFTGAHEDGIRGRHEF